MKYGVLIMRGEPIHNMHKALIDLAKDKVDHLIVIFGSEDRCRTPKNPWTVDERYDMLRGIYPEETDEGNTYFPKIVAWGVGDFRYNDQRWCEAIQNAVSAWTYGEDGDEIYLVKYIKDKSGYYQELFPQWGEINLYDEMQEKFPEEAGKLNATDIRKLYFMHTVSMHPDIKGLVPESVYEFLCKFKETDQFKTLKEEYNFYQEYRAKMSSGAYPPMCPECLNPELSVKDED